MNKPEQNDPVAGPLGRGASFLVWAGGALLIAMAFFITLDALLRQFAGYSFGMAFEYGSYAFAIGSTWAMAYTILDRGHIRIEILRNRLPATLQATCDLISWAALLVIFGLLALRATDLAIESFQSGARSTSTVRTLLFVPQGLWAFGFFYAFVVLLGLGWRMIRTRSTECVGMRDEIKAELEQLR